MRCCWCAPFLLQYYAKDCRFTRLLNNVGFKVFAHSVALILLTAIFSSENSWVHLLLSSLLWSSHVNFVTLGVCGSLGAEVEKVVGWARNHHLGLCLFEPLLVNGKLMIPHIRLLSAFY